MKIHKYRRLLLRVEWQAGTAATRMSPVGQWLAITGNQEAEAPVLIKKSPAPGARYKKAH